MQPTYGPDAARRLTGVSIPLVRRIAERLGAPIFAPEALLTTLAERDEDDDSQGYSSPPAVPRAAREPEAMSAEQLKAHLENMRPEDFGKFGL